MTSRRSETFCNIFGIPVQLKENVLPTYADLMKHFLWIKNDLLWKGNNKNPSVKDISEIVSCDIERIWKKASLPVVSHQEVIRLIRNFNEKYKNIKRIPKSRKGADKIRKVFFDEANSTLFDISACKCLNYEQCKCSVKIPSMERNFLADQRHERKMVIGSVDISATQKMKRVRERQCRRETQEAKAKELADNGSSSKNITDLEANVVLGSDSELEEISENDDDYVGPKAKYQKITDDETPSTSKAGQMRISLPNLAVACDRTGVSDRSAAIIASSVLHDIGIVSKDTQSKVIDRSKLRRERRKVRLQLNSTQVIQSLYAIYFDGRKDKTIVQEKKGSSYYRTVVVEEHIVLLSEPGSVYIGHVTPDSGSSADITQSIIKFFTLKRITLSELVAVGCDGTNVNVGKKNGTVRRLETFVGHKLHWFVCLLHTNELPLRRLFQKIDGKTSGPQQFSGMIGKSLETCETLALTSFTSVPVALPEIDKNDLSADQKYLLDISKAVSSGECPPDLANRSPGTMSHSRWLTTANRILRLYVSTAEPSESFKLLVEYVMKVYVKSWFEIKKIPEATHGARHLQGMIKKSSFLPEEFKLIVHEVIQRNSYFAHSENVLLAMLFDERSHVRELGLRRILKSRKTDWNGKIRQFDLPNLNFQAEEYFDMINWDNPLEPPGTMNLSDEDITNMIKNGSQLEIEKLPCHSQAVERHVRLVTQASLATCGAEARDGYIRSGMKSRKELPKFDTKVNYFGKNVESLIEE